MGLREQTRDYEAQLQPQLQHRPQSKPVTVSTGTVAAMPMGFCTARVFKHKEGLRHAYSIILSGHNIKIFFAKFSIFDL